ncbi:LysE/ArgO family amino acid transporter [Salinisphaera sp. Q1T1-3]|uniref:LysE/ArgO family amino acid transporter n=1 Tax=Salinisphaera sp. Q1T1-3 TaxID=2321229 RepID=UPI000E7117B1|nr:LysE family transporter [Salinisphaera sp. Q1T1-3]RJS92475.1 amino acid transporter [Salinisphaera sp. Q1T1-3]
MVFFSGLIAGLGLIVAIGAQNAFVLRQGLADRHVGLVVALCVVSDAVLISAGVFGLGAALAGMPRLSVWLTLAGIVCLVAYGLQALRRAIGGGGLLADEGCGGASAIRVASTTLALTWLNPHVYIDTVMLLGTLGQAHPAARPAFAAGAITASLLFFGVLGYGARAAAPWLARPRTWCVLDGLIALVMFGFALRLAATL